MDHVLFYGPPGLGKTTLAHVIAQELGVGLRSASGPAVEHKGVLASHFVSIGERGLLFIDEIHRLLPALEEKLYPAMEDYQLDLLIGQGAGARSIKLDIPKFTLIGATTRAGLITAPLRGRFGIVFHLDFYPHEDLEIICKRSAEILGVEIDDDGAREIARRSRGTPRIVNRLLRRVRDIAAEVRGEERPSDIEARRELERQQMQGMGMGQGPVIVQQGGSGLGTAGAVLGGVAAGAVLGSILGGSERAHARSADDGSGRYTPIDDFDGGDASSIDVGGSGGDWSDGGGDMGGGGGDFD